MESEEAVFMIFCITILDNNNLINDWKYINNWFKNDISPLKKIYKI